MTPWDPASWHPAVKSLARMLVAKPCAKLLEIALGVVARGRPVRIGTLNAKGRLSIVISYIEPYLRSLEVEGVVDPWVIVINPGRCPNEQLTAMYGRRVSLIDDRRPYLRAVLKLIHRVLVGGRSVMGVRLRSGHGPQFWEAWREGKPSLRFTKSEEASGRELLRDMGIPPGTPHVCLILRDAAYYQQFLTPDGRARGLNREAASDTHHRNPPLAHYLPMATSVAAQGMFVLRMGQVVGEPLPPFLHPNIFDYASKYRSPFGDIYVAATCKFMVSGASGLTWVASAFDRPVVLTDSYVMSGGFAFRPGDIFIPATFRRVGDQRFLTFREMLEAKSRYTFIGNCEQDGVELVHNTPAEIMAVVDEMNRRLDGTWVAGPEDEELQARFKAVYPRWSESHGMPGRIGADFLRAHADLL